ncbi:MAG TPA: hypothetical protein ENG05_01330 [Acidilobales archaeon]|nr:hypothetical protein [Acidilobales archaeon]
MIEPSLSLLVDGDVVTEAIVIDSEGSMLCYPCMKVVSKFVKLLGKLVFELIKSDALRIADSYVIMYLVKHNMATIPLSRNKALILVVDAKFNPEDVVREYIRIINKLMSVERSEGGGNVYEDYKSDNLNSSNEERYLRLLSRIGILSREGLVSTIAIVDREGKIYPYPRSLSVRKDVINTLLSFHRRFYEVLRYRGLRLSLNDIDLVLIPLDIASAGSILLAEVNSKIPTSLLLRRLKVTLYGLT